MKFRTCLLAVCMVVVPTLAMFSHHLPADTRRSVRDCVHGVHDWFAGTLASIGTPSVSTAAAPDQAGEGPGAAVSRDDGPRDAAAHEGVAAATGPSGAPPPEAPPLPGAPPLPASLDEVVRHLADLGAESIECVALPGLAGQHLASCRVPLDSARQLHRVFQTEGLGAEAATRRLLDEVNAWKRRTAQRTAAEPTAGPAAGRR
jgi:hypothetical protein